MPTKRPTRRRPVLTKQDQFSGLAGLWKQVAQFGLSGCVAATMMYAVLVMLPASNKEHMAQMRSDREGAFQHGSAAVEKIAGAIDKNTTAIQSLLSNQQSVRGNQSEGLKMQREMVDILKEATDPRSNTRALPPRPPIEINPATPNPFQ